MRIETNEFLKKASHILKPYYPNAETWLEKNRQRIIDAAKLHKGINILKAFEVCINKRGKLDFFFKDIARYLPSNGVGAGLISTETPEEYFNRTGLAGSMAKDELKPLTDKEKAEGEKILQALKNKFPRGT